MLPYADSYGIAFVIRFHGQKEKKVLQHLDL